MRSRSLLILAAALFAATVCAEQQLPVINGPADAEAAPEPPSEAQQLEQHCRSLQKQMRELKNRPLRRSALADRYKLECQDAPYGGP